ncbi:MULTISPECIES: hypothetical protein [Arthrobacter]|uniref:Uncharacterized protein n=1 Tax=Arthrobacter terricola TaxID=2547396 RepID=A0A4V6PIB4_9MICC|nr:MULTISPECIES: hypothetical protein [Arthrobacter]MBT8163480.1 hypothetical protein [Arthrobacter sp. GN70]TDF89474.1 hypothetical protein E1809_22975 [Arthrobacter terricola]
MGSTDTNKIKRTRQVLVYAIAVLTAVVTSLMGSMVVAARTDNGFMLSVIVPATIVFLLTEGVFVGKLISLGRPSRL